ncbi:hypothetical protein P4N68_05045 [Corynebacterium felinum]|uniref:Lipoprotein LpqN n=1 Tax=Corynebacterium felinum TaxID=131318 RepID=A0ABU2BCL3_9CORY|nr:hypothetical protein [Corynebacterium felinum]MDF5820445.1 hypothetical protein [Corynebacterium felinum]MDR7355483.1 hypothetical protein [Corynebacterium felinum]
MNIVVYFKGLDTTMKKIVMLTALSLLLAGCSIAQSARVEKSVTATPFTTTVTTTTTTTTARNVPVSEGLAVGMFGLKVPAGAQYVRVFEDDQIPPYLLEGYEHLNNYEQKHVYWIGEYPGKTMDEVIAEVHALLGDDYQSTIIDGMRYEKMPPQKNPYRNPQLNNLTYRLCWDEEIGFLAHRVLMIRVMEFEREEGMVPALSISYVNPIVNNCHADLIGELAGM